jgi:hypothetical protein
MLNGIAVYTFCPSSRNDVSGESNRVSWGTEPSEYQGGRRSKSETSWMTHRSDAHLFTDPNILASEGGIDKPVSSFGSSPRTLRPIEMLDKTLTPTAKNEE